MTDLITFLDNNGKSSVYTEGNIHGIYSYLEMIVYPTTLTNSGQLSVNFVPSSSIKNDTASLQTFISALRIRQRITCKFCESIGHKSYSCIIPVPKLLLPSLRRNMNQFNALHGY